MARSLLFKPTKTLTSLLYRSFSPISNITSSSVLCPSLSLLHHLRPLSSLSTVGFSNIRSYGSKSINSPLDEPSPIISEKPPKEMVLLDGCDFKHWLVVMDKPEFSRDEIIDKYINTLAMVVGSKEEARMKIYSVSTRCYYAFGALVSKEVSNKLKELPNVCWVLADSYLNVANKDYGGEPFINGRAVLPYDPKYHEEWMRNNARAYDRNRCTDRPRSRTFEKRQQPFQFSLNNSWFQLKFEFRWNL